MLSEEPAKQIETDQRGTYKTWRFRGGCSVRDYRPSTEPNFKWKGKLIDDAINYSNGGSIHPAYGLEITYWLTGQHRGNE